MDDKDQRIAQCARKFCVMNELLISRAVFLQPADPNFPSEHSQRYENAENSLKGVVAELHEEVPGDLHGMMESHSRFRDIVSWQPPYRPNDIC